MTFIVIIYDLFFINYFKKGTIHLIDQTKTYILFNIPEAFNKKLVLRIYILLHKINISYPFVLHKLRAYISAKVVKKRKNDTCGELWHLVKI